MKCPKCKIEKEMVEKIDNYHYRESGLDNVMLTDCPIYKCLECKLELPRIPNILDVHLRIAEQIIRKNSALIAQEIRFLRKELDLKEVELASYLGVDKVTVSRWETGANKIDAPNDKLLRLFFIYKKKGETLGIGPTLAIFGKTIAKKTPPAKPTKIEIPSARFLPNDSQDASIPA